VVDLFPSFGRNIYPLQMHAFTLVIMLQVEEYNDTLGTQNRRRLC
jgi:hypothetical protein